MFNIINEDVEIFRMYVCRRVNTKLHQIPEQCLNKNVDYFLDVHMKIDLDYNKIYCSSNTHTHGRKQFESTGKK